MTVSEILKEVSRSLCEVSDCPDFEAAELVKAVTGFDTTALRMNKNAPVTEEIRTKLLKMSAQRITGYPLQYILGKWEFYSLPFLVGEGVLIPQPDTETLVDSALEFLEKNKPLRAEICDLCAGSGCVAIAAAKNYANCSVTAVELYDKAFEYLEKNISLNNAENVTAKKADIFNGPDAAEKGKYDLILSNPPYIAAKIIKTLSAEVRHEPETALNGGNDGLDFYRAIAEKWKDALKPGGVIMAEIGYDQSEAVTEIFRENFTSVELIPDLNGIMRVVTAKNANQIN